MRLGPERKEQPSLSLLTVRGTSILSTEAFAKTGAETFFCTGLADWPERYRPAPANDRLRDHRAQGSVTGLGPVPACPRVRSTARPAGEVVYGILQASGEPVQGDPIMSGSSEGRTPRRDPRSIIPSGQRLS